MMRVDDYLHLLRSLPIGTLADVAGIAPFVVVSPHPDDESLGTGGLIAAACSQAQHVDVVLVTDGAGSHPNSRAYPADRLARLRKAEIEQAGGALGLPADRLTCLDLPDAHVPTSGPSFDAAVARLAGVVDVVGAETVFVTWQHDPHCDHDASARMALTLRRGKPGLKLWSYPIWGWHLGADERIDAPAPNGYRLDISRWIGQKQAAIAAHRSQMTDLIDDDPDGFRFTPETLAPFLGPFEYFIEVPL